MILPRIMSVMVHFNSLMKLVNDVGAIVRGLHIYPSEGQLKAWIKEVLIPKSNYE
jgi:hypothetical protein